jgi:predicted dehydrogenase
MKQVRVGFIGAGSIAVRHINILRTFEDVAVVAVTAPRLNRAQALAERCGGTAYTDYTEMLEREQLDALYICVPPFAHGDLERAALDRGLPFFVEKPLAVDAATAETIAERVAQQNLVTSVGYHWRYLDTIEEVQAVLSTNPARLALGYWLSETPPPSWWIKEAESGGQMVEQTTHIFDLTRLLMGEVTKVYAAAAPMDRPAFPEADIDMVSTATLHFASGALGTVASTSILHWSHRIGLHLFSEGMTIEVTQTDLIIQTGRDRPVRRVEADPFVPENRDFIDAVQGKANRIRVPYAEALKTHRLLMSVARSAREGRAMDL